MKALSLLAAAMALSCAGCATAQALPPLAESERPLRMSGMGLNVDDLEAQKAFYTDVLGYKTVVRVPGPDGTAYEYILSMDGTLTGGALLVLTKHDRDAGSTSFGRIVLAVPDGRAMAERAVAGGATAENLRDGTNFIKDPEGNLIELYQRPAAPAGA